MADEIRQEIGLDVSDALAALKKLDTALATFDKRQASTVESMKTFNRQSGKEVKALKLIATNASKAAEQIERLNRAQGKRTTTGITSKTRTAATATTKKESLLSGDAAAKEMDKFMAGAEARVRQNQTTWQRWSSAVRGYIGQANSNVQSHAKSTQTSAQQARQAVDKWVVSWETMARVVTTQAIVRALSTLRNAFKASLKDAIAFERSVAEIRTISATKNLDTLKKSVRELSDEFNVPLTTVSEGVYQTISNQVGDGAEAFNFFAEAAKFGKVAVTSADDAVNLLSGTLNAYGKEVSETDEISAKFFKTIELGRTRGSELAQNFGEVAPVANQLGVSLEELQAAFATVTISGINTSKASTQLKGVMAGLIKPTVDMKETLKELGFESGESIIAAHGLGGAMKLLAGTTDGTSAGLAKLFPRIRGLTAAMILSGEGSDKMVDNLNQIETATSEMLDKEYEFIFNTNAETVERQVNELKNVFTDLGGQFIEAGLGLTKWLGGVDTMKAVIQSVVSLAPLTVTALGLLATGYTYLALQAKFAALEMATATAAAYALVGIPAAIFAGVLVGKRAALQVQKSMEESIKLGEKYVKQRENIEKRIANAEERRLKENLQLQRQVLAEKNKIYLREYQNAADTYDRQVKAQTSAIGRIIDNYKRVADEQMAISKRNDDLIEKSNSRVLDAATKKEDKLFQMKISNYDDEWQVRKLIERSSKISRDAEEAAAKAAQADDPADAIAKAKADFDRADALLSQASSIISSNKELGNQNRIIDQMNRNQERLERGERNYRQGLAKTGAEAEKTSRIMAERIPDLREMEAEYAELMKRVDETGEPLDPSVIKRNGAKAAQLLTKFLRASLGQDLPVDKMLDFSKVRQQLQQEVSGVDIQTVKATPQATADFLASIQEAADKFAIDVTVRAKGQLEKATGIDVVDQRSAEEAFQKIHERQRIVSSDQTLINSQLQREAQFREKIKGLSELKRQPDSFIGAEGAMPQELPLSEIDVKVNEVIDALIKLGQEGDITGNKVAAIGSTIKEIQADEGFLGIGGFSEGEKQGLTEILKLITTIATQRDSATMQGVLQGKSMEEVSKRLAEEQKVNQEYFDALDESSREMKQNTEGAATASGGMQTNLSQSVAPSAAIAANMERAARASAAGMTGMSGMTAYAGRYFAAGGQARGIDTIPAMLAKNEFVINPSSSRRFYSQLQAINAGSRPVYRDSGGPVTNIGDVSITVQDSGSPQVTARAVMQAFQRERRRGSSR
jgi:TP901 family phage tail tape measure protein